MAFYILFTLGSGIHPSLCLSQISFSSPSGTTILEFPMPSPSYTPLDFFLSFPLYSYTFIIFLYSSGLLGIYISGILWTTIKKVNQILKLLMLSIFLYCLLPNSISISLSFLSLFSLYYLSFCYFSSS